MGLIGTLLRVVKEAVQGLTINNTTVDPGGGATHTAEQYGPPGDDSTPLDGDYVALLQIPGQDQYVAVGYVDAKNSQESEPGERRLYSRDSDGNPSVTLRLRPDGSAALIAGNASIDVAVNGTVTVDNGAASVEISSDGAVSVRNGIGSIELSASGSVDINGAAVDTILGDVTSKLGVSLSFHTHTGVTVGGGVTGPPVIPPPTP